MRGLKKKKNEKKADRPTPTKSAKMMLTKRFILTRLRSITSLKRPRPQLQDESSMFNHSDGVEKQISDESVTTNDIVGTSDQSSSTIKNERKVEHIKVSTRESIASSEEIYINKVELGSTEIDTTCPSAHPDPANE